MSNFVHKVKDAMTGNNHPETKGPNHGSSTMANKQDVSHANNYGTATATNPSHMGSTQNPPAAQYGSSNPGVTTHETTMPGLHSGGNLGTGTGTNTYGSGMGGYGTSNINAGPHDSKLANKLDPRVDSDLDHRGANTSTMTGSSDVNPSGTTHGHHTRSTTHTGPGSNIAHTMEPRAEPHIDNRAYQHGAGGAVAGGSSHVAPDTGKRGTSGPHNSSLLNKIDPRVHSSEHEHTGATGHQRGL